MLSRPCSSPAGKLFTRIKPLSIDDSHNILPSLCPFGQVLLIEALISPPPLFYTSPFLLTPFSSLSPPSNTPSPM